MHVSELINLDCCMEYQTAIFLIFKFLNLLIKLYHIAQFLLIRQKKVFFYLFSVFAFLIYIISIIQKYFCRYHIFIQLFFSLIVCKFYYKYLFHNSHISSIIFYLYLSPIYFFVFSNIHYQFPLIIIVCNPYQIQNLIFNQLKPF